MPYKPNWKKEKHFPKFPTVPSGSIPPFPNYMHHDVQECKEIPLSQNEFKQTKGQLSIS